MNNSDQVVGTWKHPLTGKKYGFFYDRELLKTSEFEWLDLLLAKPNAINYKGVVVGHQMDRAFAMINTEFANKKSIIHNLPSNWKVRRTSLISTTTTRS